jgi:small redox-active disulfide protein 2
MKTIAVLGTGCAKCLATVAAAYRAIEQTGVDATITKIEDPAEIMTYDVMRTPALAIDGTVHISGRVPSPDEIAALLRA